MLFLLEVQEFRHQFLETEESRERARKIAVQYLTRDGPLEINLQDVTRMRILDNLGNNITREIYLAAEKEIFILVKTDSLKKWYTTPDFKEVLTRIVSNRNSSALGSFELQSTKET